MHRLRGPQLVLAVVFLWQTTAPASVLDDIGVTLLRTETTNLNGTGVRVEQPEAYDNGTTNWEVNPGAGGVGQPVSLFTYTSSLGTTNTYPNSINTESGHADAVAANFYGIAGGVATNVAHVDNYDANYFINDIVNAQAAIAGRVVNQSFIGSPADQSTYDQIYDWYAARYNTLFVSGIGNGGQVYPPATCYNGLGVAAYGGSSSIGPTLDNGRCKPDITAPAGATSFSTPLVSGAAAVLVQAGLRGDGGSDTNGAVDLRTVKALLLNGAVKPSDWTNGSSAPLDARYGAGVLNVFNSYEQLAGGKHGYIVSTYVPTNSPHPPTGAAGTVDSLSGWDYNTNISTTASNVVKHYYFNVTNGTDAASFTATITLVWARHRNSSGINNLALFLYDALSSNLVACSTSLVDNVEHIFVPGLPQSRYDLQVLKQGGTTVTTNETYALAFEFFSTSLDIAKSGANVGLQWPVYPAGFVLESATNLAAPVVWNTNNPIPAVTNALNNVVLNATNRSLFFRLQRP